MMRKFGSEADSSTGMPPLREGEFWEVKHGVSNWNSRTCIRVCLMRTEKTWTIFCYRFIKYSELGSAPVTEYRKSGMHYLRAEELSEEAVFMAARGVLSTVRSQQIEAEEEAARLAALPGRTLLGKYPPKVLGVDSGP